MLYSIPDHIKISRFKRKKFSGSASCQNAFAVLKDRYNERSFLINETICRFLEKFITAKDLVAANKEIALEANVSEENVRPFTEPFFDHLKKMEFIVNATSYKPVRTKALLRKNKVVDDYRIKAKLDSTSKTDIYVARHVASKKNVVIKLLKQTHTENYKEFKKEYHLLTILDSSGVTPRVFGLKEEKDYCYFIQEHIKGMELNNYLEVHSNMRFKSFLSVASAIIHSFSVIHHKGIVHGDIHPANLFVTSSKEVRVIDFGFALHQKLERNEIVNHGGVYFYMPPERINSTTHHKFLKQPDFFSDVFQFGVVLYKMLYNKYPFNGITWEELAWEIKEKEPVFKNIAVFDFPVPAWMKQLIQKCLSKDPQQRFADAAQLKKAFQKNMNHARKI